MNNDFFEKRQETRKGKKNLSNNLQKLNYNEFLKKVEVDVLNASNKGVSIKLYWPYNDLNKKKIKLSSLNDGFKLTGEIVYLKKDGKYSSTAGIRLIDEKIPVDYIEELNNQMEIA